MLKGDEKDDHYDYEYLGRLADEIIEVSKMGVELILVVGGGNIWRARDSEDSGIDRVVSDYMGMMATLMNASALQSVIENKGEIVRVCSALEAPQIAEPYRRRKVIRHLEKGRIVFCAGGTGLPYFTTDSGAALRAVELKCDVLLKATKVDGVYDKDPEKNDDAKRYDNLKYSEVLAQDLKVMDLTAVSIAKDGNLPIIVFNLHEKGNIKKIIEGEDIGSLISN